MLGSSTAPPQIEHVPIIAIELPSSRMETARGSHPAHPNYFSATFVKVVRLGT